MPLCPVRSCTGLMHHSSLICNSIYGRGCHQCAFGRRGGQLARHSKITQQTLVVPGSKFDDDASARQCTA
eukprot:2509126-Amphidinium_carterae.1